MSFISQKDFFFEVSKGNVTGHSIVHKFGRNTAVGTTFVPITETGLYQTPQTGSATTLRIKAGGNANDTAAGSGAREVTLVGLDETGAEVTEAVATAGASASSATTTTFMRLYRAYVSASGTYATASAGSHSADIDIENGAGGTDWATISATAFPNGQTNIACYSVPLGKTAYVKSIEIFVDATKVPDILFFKRENILETAAPYTAMRLQLVSPGTEGAVPIRLNSPLGPFPALTDIGFMAAVSSGTADVAIDFEIYLVDA